ncbi:MAG TPA: cupin domain-containing protein [Noviherbaspirillum sp.]
MMQNPKAFSPFALQHGLLADMQQDEFPTRLLAWSHQALELTRGATHFGFVFSGEAVLNCTSGSFTLKPGMYFSVSGSATVSGSSEGIIVSRLGYDGFFQLGGPVEESGRLNYIDGCTDSLLIAPIMIGDPCLNLLCFPPGIDQTSHTHPSMRVGIVVSGEGICHTREDSIPLRPGQVFIIHAHQEHAFATQGQAMRVIAYHPDSDFGATHQDHPMINRTIVDGVSAAELPHLQTR